MKNNDVFVLGGLSTSSSNVNQEQAIDTAEEFTILKTENVNSYRRTLPSRVANQCFVKISKIVALSIGGSTDDEGISRTGKAFLYYHNEDLWIQTDDLNTPRSHHSCAVLTLTSGQILVVAAGGQTTNIDTG